MEFDITTLIHEIKARKPLWQRDNYNRSCRDVINTLWTEVATKMGVPKELVKTKWKGLRDNFRSELRKIPKKRHHVHQSKWIYFSDMMFIKDQMTSRSSDTNTIVSGDAENVNIYVDVYAMDDSESLVMDKVDDIKNDKSGYQFVNINDLVNTSSTKCNDVRLDTNNDGFNYDNTMVVSSDGLMTPVKQTLNDNVGFLTESVSDQDNPTKRRKLSAGDKSCYINLHNDDDFYFLMSFLPMIKTLPPDKRMFLRFKIQHLVYNEVYNCSKNKN